MINKQSVKSLIKIILGNALLALAYAKWMVPYTIINGGVTSLSLVVQKVIPIDLPLITNSLTVILLIICGVFLGKSYLMKSIVGSLSYMSFFSLFYFLPFEWITWLPLDFMLACIVIAFGYYCCLSEGSTTVGVDVIALIVHQKNPKMDVAKMIRYLNISVLILGLITYGVQSVIIGFLFSVVYTWFLGKFLLIGVTKQSDVKEIAKN